MYLIKRHSGTWKDGDPRYGSGPAMAAGRHEPGFDIKKITAAFSKIPMLIRLEPAAGLAWKGMIAQSI